MISSAEHFKPLLGLNWFHAVNFQLGTNQIVAIATDNQSDNELKRELEKKHHGLVQCNQTIEISKDRFIIEIWKSTDLLKNQN